ncbi:insecticyanin-B-like [Cloeon dipterum]|uniref:insecticyanin-B-like n=1 Tax=Cloeon dipterum TaxID=197152 RepID=UPI0032200925
MQNLTFAFVAVAALALAAAAPKQDSNNCPSLQPMTNFNASEMVGVWYDIAHTNRRTGLKLKCDLIKFSPDLTDPSKLEFNSFSYSSATKSVVSVAGKICSPTKKNVPDGTIAVTIPSLNIEKVEMKVLSTDYKTFAVLAVCHQLGNGTSFPKALVLTREHEPSTKLKNAAFKVLDNNKIARRTMSLTSHSKCHSYDLSSKTEQQASTLGHGTSLGGIVSLPNAAQQDAATTKHPKSR